METELYNSSQKNITGGLSRNALKAIACISMLFDHIGVVLFPSIMWFRIVGRLAMPIFAFFIGVGCRYTHSRIRYFLRVFLMALLCQAVFTAEEIINGQFYRIYFNILITFSLSMPICFSLTDFLDALRNARRGEAVFLILSVAFAVFVCYFAGDVVGIPITTDYGLPGVFLPVFAVVFYDVKNARQRFTMFAVFSIGTLLFAAALSYWSPLEWFSLLSLPLLWLYNGLPGDRRADRVFYFFYPAHLGILYLISLLISAPPPVI